MSQFTLTTQNPKQKFLGKGILSVDRNGTATFYSDNAGKDSKELASMTRASIWYANSEVIVLQGLELSDSNRGTYIIQEWVLHFTIGINMNDTVETYKDALSNMDWYYNYSDDYSVYKRGMDALAEVRRLQKLFDPRYELWNTIAPKEFRR